MNHPLPLADDAQPCVGSGFCCKVAPCPFGEVTSEDNPACRFLVKIEQPVGKHQRYTCGKYDEIVTLPGWELAPAFGAGCCSTIGNSDRNAIMKDIKAEFQKHHRRLT